MPRGKYNRKSAPVETASEPGLLPMILSDQSPEEEAAGEGGGEGGRKEQEQPVSVRNLYMLELKEVERFVEDSVAKLRACQEDLAKTDADFEAYKTNFVKAAKKSIEIVKEEKRTAENKLKDSEDNLRKAELDLTQNLIKHEEEEEKLRQAVDEANKRHEQNEASTDKLVEKKVKKALKDKDNEIKECQRSLKEV